jgi:hypothetical protein
MKGVNEASAKLIDSDGIKGRIDTYSRLRASQSATGEAVSSYVKDLKESGIHVPAFQLVYRLNRMALASILHRTHAAGRRRGRTGQQPG